MIEIKNRFTGEIIHSGEFVSVKECLLDATENDVNLRSANLDCANLRGVKIEGANLDCANLRGANLDGANLRGASLDGANLEGASLWDANLRGANLRGANLRGASLRGASLRGVNLRWCAGNKSEIKSLWFSDAYPITYTAEYMQIGCERHKIADWWKFDDKRILEMDGKTALKFWRENKDLIKQIIDANPAKATGKESGK